MDCGGGRKKRPIGARIVVGGLPFYVRGAFYEGCILKLMRKKVKKLCELFKWDGVAFLSVRRTFSSDEKKIKGLCMTEVM